MNINKHPNKTQRKSWRGEWEAKNKVSRVFGACRSSIRRSSCCPNLNVHTWDRHLVAHYTHIYLWWVVFEVWLGFGSKTHTHTYEIPHTSYENILSVSNIFVVKCIKRLLRNVVSVWCISGRTLEVWFESMVISVYLVRPRKVCLFWRFIIFNSFVINAQESNID